MPLPPPIVAVIAVVLRGDELLLVRRANPPDAGLWGFPGGKVEGGETLLQAAQRELAEETGVAAEALTPFNALDIFDRAEDGTPRRHFVLVAVLCRWQSGDPLAADDALDAGWFRQGDLDPVALPMSAAVGRIARQAIALARQEEGAIQGDLKPEI